MSGKERIRVAVLGCTGSIGRQTLDVCRKHADKLEVVALSAHSSVAELVADAKEFGVRCVGIADERLRHDPLLCELPEGCVLYAGEDAALLASLDEVDCVVLAVVGFAGIEAALRAVESGKRVAYANKESIVVAGDLLMPMLAPDQLVPVDSEHSAIFQCLVGESHAHVRRIWLTCSGGPFYGYDRERLRSVTAAEALAHPTWNMGPKITVDSATLMNKGLEVLEAHHLFDVSVDAIRVLVHPQSRIHSMVEYVDGSVKAQLGPSDMRIPIQYGMSYPDRWDAPCDDVDWCAVGSLDFGEADEEAFGCLALAREAGREGGTLPCAMNAANEVVNAAFRKGTCGFLDIERVVRAVMERTSVERVDSLQMLRECDAAARAMAREVLSEVMG